MRSLAAARRVGKQIVNVPSFLVRVDSQKHIDFALNSPFGGGRPGRNKRKAQKCAAPCATGLGHGKNTRVCGLQLRKHDVHQVACHEHASLLASQLL